MISLESEIKGLIKVIKIFGWLAVIVGVMGILALITTSHLGLTLKSASRTLVALSGGIFYLIVAEGLSRKKKWAWYSGIIAFIYSAVSNFLVWSALNIAAGVIALVFLALLVKGKKIFF